jgi:hypothetical protein
LAVVLEEVVELLPRIVALPVVGAVAAAVGVLILANGDAKVPMVRAFVLVLIPPVEKGLAK